MSDFHDQVLAEFSFLAKDHGFVTTVEGDRMIVFTGPDSIIRVGIGRRGDVGITFDRPKEEHFLPFAFYMRTLFPQESCAWQDRESWSKFELAMNVRDLATALIRFGADVISGDPAMFSEIQCAALRELES